MVFSWSMLEGRRTRSGRNEMSCAQSSITLVGDDWLEARGLLP
jgi:hypothetical protein